MEESFEWLLTQPSGEDLSLLQSEDPLEWNVPPLCCLAAPFNAGQQPARGNLALRVSQKLYPTACRARCLRSRPETRVRCAYRLATAPSRTRSVCRLASRLSGRTDAWREKSALQGASSLCLERTVQRGSREVSPHWSPGMDHRSDAWTKEGTPPSKRAGTMKKRSLNAPVSDILCDTRSLCRRPRRKDVT